MLATRSGRKLGGIQASNIHFRANLNAYDDLSFRVYRYDNGVECKLWNQIKDFKLVWCREWDTWFEIYVEVNEDSDTVKDITARSLGEAELSQINLYDIEINTENDIARDDYEPTVLYDESNPNASLLDRIMEKAPHYSIEHVDYSIAGIQRTFTFDGTTLYDAFQTIAEEIDCIFIIDSGSNPDGTIKRSIRVYDLESYCTQCGHRGSFVDKCPECDSDAILTGYGDDTNIFVCTDNLADGITYSVDTDSVKNCFRLEAGDDLMSATVRNCNPNGSDYIWYISDEMKADMSPELAEKIDSYNELYQYYKNEHSVELDPEILAKYNALVQKYGKYSKDLKDIPSPIVGYADLMGAYYDTIDLELYLESELMPTPEMIDTTAGEQVAKLTSFALSPVAVADVKRCSSASATSAVLSMAKVLVDSRYQVRANDGTLDGTTWTGTFTVTNYTDDSDTATSGRVSVIINDDVERFMKQKLDKALSGRDNESTLLQDLFGMTLPYFKNEIQKYCLNSLNSFYDACRACVDILIQQGVSDGETWSGKDPNLYDDLYMPYYEKMKALEAEIKLREEEIEIVTGSYDDEGYVDKDGLQTLIESENAKIQDVLDFEKYVGTDLWLEFAAYRREDTYTNDNFISDGLNNRELFDLAREFIDVAENDIYKSATLQHSITATLKNLLVMKEFEPIVDYFMIGNWIRVRVNDEVFRLRLIAYEIDFDNLNTLAIEFSDVMMLRNGISDSRNILEQAASMASSYGAVSRQAQQGKKAAQEVNEWVNRGLSLTKTKIINKADNQDIKLDKLGILCREYIPTLDTYDERQLKIISRGLYVTDDDWETAKAGIGNFQYYDPRTGETVDAYGVIADTLVGNLILSEKVGIYNKKNSILMDENGIVLTATPYEGEEGESIFTLRRKSQNSHGDDVYEDVVYMDSDGNAHFSGIIDAASGYFSGEVAASSLTIEGDDVGDYLNVHLKQYTDPLDERIQEAEAQLVVQADQISSKVSRGDVASVVEQSADKIRLQASKLEWKSTYSSMTEDGKLSCTGATVDGDIVARTLKIDNTTVDQYVQGKVNSGVSSAMSGYDSRISTVETQLSVQSGLIQSKVSRDDVASLISQNADSIRLKAAKIAWSSTNSSMTEDGKLTCKSADISGTFHAGNVTMAADGIHSVDASDLGESSLTIVGPVLNGYGEVRFDGDTGFIPQGKLNLIGEQYYSGSYIDGPTLRGNKVSLDCDYLFISTLRGSAYRGYTGNVDVGNSTVMFINGICTGVQ